jgi:hypothetical protein
MYIGLGVKYPLFFSDFNETKIFSADFSKTPQVANSIKILKVGAEFRADRQRDKHDRANSSFSYCCEKADKSGENFLKAVSVGSGRSQRR